MDKARKTAVNVAQNVPPRRQLVDSICKAAFVVGSCLIVFVAARNTITYEIQRFWRGSGSFWQSLLDSAYVFFGNNDYDVSIYGTMVVTMTVYWMFNFFLILLDLFNWPKFLMQYKIQPDVNEPVEPHKLAHAILVVLFNQTVVGLPVSIATFYLYKWRDCQFSGPLPTFQWVIFEIAVFTLVEEVGFYYSHRMLHHPKIYKHIHKKHHEWTAPIGIISLYAHPVEHILSNLIPPILGPLLLGSHGATIWLWFCLALMSTSIAHCGYHFPLLPSPEAHDFHHYKFVNNFGVLGVLDRLHGTDELFRASKAYERHILLLGTVPLRKQIPENDKKNSKMSPDDSSVTSSSASVM